MLNKYLQRVRKEGRELVKTEGKAGRRLASLLVIVLPRNIKNDSKIKTVQNIHQQLESEDLSLYTRTILNTT